MNNYDYFIALTMFGIGFVTLIGLLILRHYYYRWVSRRAEVTRLVSETRRREPERDAWREASIARTIR